MLVSWGEVIEPEVLANALAKAALEKKARDVVILDLRNLIDYSDVIVICTGGNRRQVQAIADEVRRVAKASAVQPVGVEGTEGARWVLVDYGSVVVHIFDEPVRPFYNLEGMWADAPRLPVPEVDGAAASSDKDDDTDPDDGSWT